ncbi:hypothetical protein GCM10019998_21400 [Tetragenococcus solitarius]|uniref:Uncharacterized protein n=1 Tax=Tetragenococcus solitarius TaxID=71453 RepID=A0ABN3YEF8_9ENTE
MKKFVKYTVVSILQKISQIPSVKQIKLHHFLRIVLTKKHFFLTNKFVIMTYMCYIKVGGAEYEN